MIAGLVVKGSANFYQDLLFVTFEDVVYAYMRCNIAVAQRVLCSTYTVYLYVSIYWHKYSYLLTERGIYCMYNTQYKQHLFLKRRGLPIPYLHMYTHLHTFIYLYNN